MHVKAHLEKQTTSCLHPTRLHPQGKGKEGGEGVGVSWAAKAQSVPTPGGSHPLASWSSYEPQQRERHYVRSPGTKADMPGIVQMSIRTAFY